MFNIIKMIKVNGTGVDFTVLFSDEYTTEDYTVTAKTIVIGSDTYFVPNSESKMKFFSIEQGNSTAYVNSIEVMSSEPTAIEFASFYLDAYTCTNSGTVAPVLADGIVASDISGLFGILTTDIKNTLKNAARNHSQSYGTDKVAEFGERYYWIVKNHGSTYDFMGIYNEIVQSANPSLNNGIINSATVTTTVIIISVLSMTTLCGYFLLRKRKEER